MFRFLMLAAAAAIVIGWAEPAHADEPRAPTLDDILSLEAFGRASISPDGRWAVYEKRGPYEGTPRFDLAQRSVWAAFDLWCVDLSRPEAVPVRLLPDEGIGLLRGDWSPSGDRLLVSRFGEGRYLSWLAGEDVERAVSASDFALGDLMCAEAPVSLYVRLAPADAAALRPLTRLLFYAAAQSLTAEEDRDAAGREKRHPLLMVMDEFPLLGRLGFFEKSLRLMSGYGIKPMLVAQSLNDIVETYGVHNTILDNCHVYTAFAALDPMTQDKVSRLTGTVAEARTSRSGPGLLGAGRSSISRSEVERPLLEPGEVRALADHEQLVFVAGRRPLRTRRLRYDRRRPFRGRARLPAPDQAAGLDAPPAPSHPWAGRRAWGEDAAATLPLFKEAVAAMDDRKAAARTAQVYARVAEEMAAQEAVLDAFQGGAGG